MNFYFELFSYGLFFGLFASFTSLIIGVAVAGLLRLIKGN